LTVPSRQPGAASPTAPASADAQKAVELLNGMADEIHGTMTKAADALASGKAADAVKSQTTAVEQIDQVFMAVAPFVNLVQKAVAAQEGLIELSKQGTTSTKDEKDTSTKDTKSKDTKKEEKKEEKKTEKKEEKKVKAKEADWGEAAWNQRFISGYGRILPGKAKMELERLEKTPAAPATPPDPKTGAPANPQAAEEQPKDMERALQAGVDLAPKVESLSTEAAASLESAQPAKARPSQEEALKLLKEMLPKQDQEKKDQDKKDQDKKDQDKKDQDKKDQDKKDQDKKDQDKKDQDKKDQKKDEKKDQKDQKEQKQQQKEDLSKKQAEDVLRRARQREQERREMEKALQMKLYGPDKVDKDW
jgi:hypothetical protein